MCFMFLEDKFRNEMVFYQLKGNVCFGMLGNLCLDMWEGKLIIKKYIEKIVFIKEVF